MDWTVVAATVEVAIEDADRAEAFADDPDEYDIDWSKVLRSEGYDDVSVQDGRVKVTFVVDIAELDLPHPNDQWILDQLEREADGIGLPYSVCDKPKRVCWHGPDSNTATVYIGTNAEAR